MTTDNTYVSSNDASLAHALARYEVLYAPYRYTNNFPRKRTLKAVFQLFRQTVPNNYMIAELIGRAQGSRAKGAIYFLTRTNMFSKGLNLLQLVFLKYDGKDNPAIKAYLQNIFISPHCIARVIQRTTNDADTSKAIEILKRHVLYVALLELNPDVDLKSVESMFTYGLGGYVIWENAEIEGKPAILAKTWIGEETCADKEEQLLAGSPIGIIGRPKHSSEFFDQILGLTDV